MAYTAISLLPAVWFVMHFINHRHLEKTDDITKSFVANLKSKLPDANFIYQDERLTTVQASTFLNATNTRGKSRKNVIDTVAAEIILQSYLDSNKTM